MADHALLSPSSASRWLSCTPSARLEAQFPDSSSEAAEEGTLAHALCELHLRAHYKDITNKEYLQELKELTRNSFYSAEMENHCAEYVNFVVQKTGADETGIVFIEKQVDLSDFIPDSFGTVDCAIVDDETLKIIDLKYGKGVLVAAENNPQLMIYALGALKKYGVLHNIYNIEMTVYQPRINNIASFEMSVNDLSAWADSHLAPRARLAFSGNGDYAAGEHCRFCKARNQCKTLMDYNMEAAKQAFKDPNELVDADIVGVLERAADLKVWLTGIQQYALDLAIKDGKNWPGFKVVAGRSNRRYLDEKSIMKILKDEKTPRKRYIAPTKLVGITALEKNLGPTEVEKLVGSLIIKPEGSPTLVPESDKRPAINSAEAAKSAFSEVKTSE